MSDRPLNVLIVEDDPALQDVYVMILSSQGYKVSKANNGIRAFEEIKKSIPDVILLDYFMPQMDGRTFLLNFDTTMYPHTKIVVATNVSDQKVLQEMIQLGASACVLKSNLSPMQIIDLVESAATK